MDTEKICGYQVAKLQAFTFTDPLSQRSIKTGYFCFSKSFFFQITAQKRYNVAKCPDILLILRAKISGSFTTHVMGRSRITVESVRNDLDPRHETNDVKYVYVFSDVLMLKPTLTLKKRTLRDIITFIRTSVFLSLRCYHVYIYIYVHRYICMNVTYIFTHN